MHIPMVCKQRQREDLAAAFDQVVEDLAAEDGERKKDEVREEQKAKLRTTMDKWLDANEARLHTTRSDIGTDLYWEEIGMEHHVDRIMVKRTN